MGAGACAPGARVRGRTQGEGSENRRGWEMQCGPQVIPGLAVERRELPDQAKSKPL